MMLKLVLNVLEPLLQSLPLGLVGFNGHGLSDFFRMACQISNVR